MGGHGALVCYLKNPGKYCSVSAFAPICNPVECPWGQKAFSGYLGENKDSWKVRRSGIIPACTILSHIGKFIAIVPPMCNSSHEYLHVVLRLFYFCPVSSMTVWFNLLQEYDSCHLLKSYTGPKTDILVDQVDIFSHISLPKLFSFFYQKIFHARGAVSLMPSTFYNWQKYKSAHTRQCFSWSINVWGKWMYMSLIGWSW